MTKFLNLIIILGALIVFLVFQKTKNYISWQGAILTTLFIFLVVTKFAVISHPQELGFSLNNLPDTLLPTIIFTLLGVIVLSTMRFKAKKFKIVSWFLSLISLYFVFGILQQIFFQSVFTHTLNELLGDMTLAVIFSGVFYSSFHWNWDAPSIKFGFLTLLGGVVWSLLFLISPNIFLLGASHAVLASLYYFIAYGGNILDKKLALSRRKIFSREFLI